MIELPEAVTLARQINETLRGKRIAEGVRGNAPHKFAFYNHTPEEYAEILHGKTVGAARDHGGNILVDLEPGYIQALGGGGERILYHTDASTLPKKHQYLWRFEDDTYLTVSVQMWGSLQLLRPEELADHSHLGPARVSPLSEGFTRDYFLGLFDELEEDDARAIKYFIISKPSVWGVGNGYLHDILYRAKLHPRRRAVDVTASERAALYEAIIGVMRQATELGGRNDEHDLFNRVGGYQRTLDSRMAGQPCPECGAAIEKIQFLGGASYFCPHCQI